MPFSLSAMAFSLHTGQTHAGVGINIVTDQEHFHKTSPVIPVYQES